MKLSVLLALLFAAVLSCAQQGFDFRTTAGFVNDPEGDVYVLPTTAYPTKGSAATYGWLNPSLVQARDRNASLDPRLAGINFVNNGSPATFYVDLPSAGTYSISLAIGDADWEHCDSQCQVQFLDGSTVLAMVSGGTIPQGSFYDATGKPWTAGAWPSGNFSQQVTLVGTRLTMVVGTTNNTGDITPIAFLGITQVAKPNFGLVSPFTIKQGGQMSCTINLSIANGFNAPVTVSAVSVPAGVTVTFNPETVSAPGSGNTNMTIAVASNTPTGLYSMVVRGDGGGMEQTALVTLTVTR